MTIVSNKVAAVAHLGLFYVALFPAGAIVYLVLKVFFGPTIMPNPAFILFSLFILPQVVSALAAYLAALISRKFLFYPNSRSVAVISTALFGVLKLPGMINSVTYLKMVPILLSLISIAIYYFVSKMTLKHSGLAPAEELKNVVISKTKDRFQLIFTIYLALATPVSIFIFVVLGFVLSAEGAKEADSSVLFVNSIISFGPALLIFGIAGLRSLKKIVIGVVSKWSWLFVLLPVVHLAFNIFLLRETSGLTLRNLLMILIKI